MVIDAGHGGHDPGAQANGVNEAELTLDVATRLSILLLKQPGVEVVMTRDNDVFVPLEERTAGAAELIAGVVGVAALRADDHDGWTSRRTGTCAGTAARTSASM